MNGDQQIVSLKTNLEKLIRNYTALKNENDIFRHQAEAQRKAMQEKNQKISELEQQITLLKTVKLITEEDPENKNAPDAGVKNKISELIREVDKCIAMMNG